MDFESFCRFCEYIAQETGLSEEIASGFAAEIGDTPDSDADGNWTATLNGLTISIKPWNWI